jgi:hypothetical protein
LNSLTKSSLWQQFGAAIDMLENALLACPDGLWEEALWDEGAETNGFAQFWYLTYHTLFWLDLYLSGSEEGFSPPAPFTHFELDPAGVLPEEPYSKAALQTYLAHCRQRCRGTIEALTDARAAALCRFGWGEVPFQELLLYNLRHVQEHATQLSLFLGQRTGAAPGWVGRAAGH